MMSKRDWPGWCRPLSRKTAHGMSATRSKRAALSPRYGNSARSGGFIDMRAFPSLAPFLINHDAANRFAFVHQVETFVDVFQLQRVRNEIVDVDLAVHVPVDDFRHVAASFCATEGGSFPHAAGDELEWPRSDFLTRSGDADDDRNAPSFMAAFECL